MTSEEREFYVHFMLQKEGVYELTKQSTLILFFEFFGTLLITCVY